MTNSCSLSPQHRHQSSSEIINSTKRPGSFIAQTEYKINGVKPPRPKLHHASCAELLEMLSRISVSVEISAVHAGQAGATSLHSCSHQRFAHHQVVFSKHLAQMLTWWLCFIMRFAFFAPAKQLQPHVYLAWPQVCRGQLSSHMCHDKSPRRTPTSRWFSLSSQGQSKSIPVCQGPDEEAKEPPFIILSVERPFQGSPPYQPPVTVSTGHH